MAHTKVKEHMMLTEAGSAFVLALMGADGLGGWWLVAGGGNRSAPSSFLTLDSPILSN